MNNIKKIGWIAAASLFGAAVLAGGGFTGYKYYEGKTYYTDHYYDGIHYQIVKPDGVTVTGEGDLSGMTLYEAAADISSKLVDYSLLIKGFDGSEETISGSAIRFGTIEDVEELLEKTMKDQKAGEWYRYAKGFSKAYKEVPLTLHYTYDAGALEAKIPSLQVIAPDEPVESAMSELIYNKETFLYEFIPPKTGNIGDEELIRPVIMDAVYEMLPEVEIPEKDYLQAPANDDAFLQAKEAEINKYLSASITLKDGDKSIAIDKKKIIDFLDITEDFEVTFVTKRLQYFINKNLDPLFDTVGIERTIETPSSGTIKISGGTFGKMVRTLLEVEQMTKEISEGKVVEREPIYYDNYITTEENAEVGDTYIDVNITEQMVYVVQDGEITYETPCVTGLDNEERRTPTGVYFVIRKARDYTMVTYDSFVHYWMPINDTTGVGLHDASWRGSFGGSIYKSNGSHGCINLPSDAAEKIFNMVPTGMTVIVHY